MKTNRIIGFFICLAVVTLPQIIAPNPILAQTCKQESRWAAEPIESLPQAYEEISTFPVEDRKAIFHRLPAQTQSALWRAHLEQFANADLTEAQQKLLLEGRRLASPALFAAAKNRHGANYQRRIKQLRDYETRMIAAFGAEKARAILSQIGPEEPMVHIESRDELLLKYEAMEAPGCSCSNDSDWCSSNYHCDDGDCELISDECGTFWTYDCDGLCWRDGHLEQ